MIKVQNYVSTNIAILVRITMSHVAILAIDVVIDSNTLLYYIVNQDYLIAF